MSDRREVGLSGGRTAALVALQFSFALTWAVYVIYLPKLFAQVGLPREWVLPLLMADQIVFAVTDLLVGVQTDRMRARVRRFGGAISIAAFVTCLAFVAMPWIAALRNVPVLLTLIAIWALASAALRVPPIMLLQRHVPTRGRPWLAGTIAIGLGLAAMGAPLLGTALRDSDPRLPFVLSSAMLLVATIVLVVLGSGDSTAAAPTSAAPTDRLTGRSRNVGVFLGVLVVLAFGFQLHTTLTSPRLFAPFTAILQLPVLLSLFWVGFTLAVVPATFLVSRFGGLRVTIAAAIVGGAAIIVTLSAHGFVPTVAAQFVAGAAWSTVVTGAFASSLTLGGAAHAGRTLGATFAAFAVATFGRMAVTATNLAADPVIVWSPPVIWIAAGVALAALAASLRLRWS